MRNYDTTTQKPYPRISGVHISYPTTGMPLLTYTERDAIVDADGQVHFIDGGERQCAVEIDLSKRDEPIQIFGDGKQRRAFACIDDIVVPISSIIANCQRFNGQVYNIGGFEDISLNDLAGRVCMNMGAPNQKIIHVEDRPQEVKYAYSSPEKAVRDLHFRIEKGIDKGLYEMSQWALSKGPQEWVNNDPMEINSEKMPSVWR